MSGTSKIVPERGAPPAPPPHLYVHVAAVLVPVDVQHLLVRLAVDRQDAKGAGARHPQQLRQPLVCGGLCGDWKRLEMRAVCAFLRDDRPQPGSGAGPHRPGGRRRAWLASPAVTVTNKERSEPSSSSRHHCDRAGCQVTTASCRGVAAGGSAAVAVAGGASAGRLFTTSLRRMGNSRRGLGLGI